MTSHETDHTGPRHIPIGSENDGQRIDNFLITLLKGVPKSRIYRILRKGEVRVNKGRIRPGYRLKKGDMVRIPPIRVSCDRPPDSPAPYLSARLAQATLYEDDGLLVINKPSGIAVHGGSGLSQGIIETLRAGRPEERFLELVHRLDRDTSGCLMVAKKRSVLRKLHELLRCDKFDKRYLALVEGEWKGGEKRVEAPLRKNMLSSGERIVRVDPQGKPAITLFRPVRRYSGATLLEATLLTGRTHQIRVHAAHVGHPIAGDAKYGSPTFNKRMRNLGLKRLFLHARTVSFELPPEDVPLEFHAPLPDELEAVLNQLEKLQARK